MAPAPTAFDPAQAFMTATQEPSALVPHRKFIRSWLRASSTQNTALALCLVAMDVIAFGATIIAVIKVRFLVFKLALGLLAGFIIARLFIIGHDACHQSLTPHRRLNAILGRLTFLPSLTPYSLWDTGHNIVHHGYTNLKGFDMVWQPLTIEDFRTLPRWRQGLERSYRSGWMPGLYYLVEIWWLRMYFPAKRYMPTRRGVFIYDGVLASLSALSWLGLLTGAAISTHQSVSLLLISGFLLPLMTWSSLIGFVIYVHHTHPRIAWYSDKAAWSQAQPFVSTTVHVTFKSIAGINMDTLLHHILQHTAHHVDMTIPLYRLKQAQAILEKRLPGCIVIQPFSWRWYFETARQCKLYDYQACRWTDFNGIPAKEPS